MVLKNLALSGKNNCSHYFIASRYSSYVLQTVRSLSVLYILCEVTKKLVRVRNNLFYLFFINNTRRYRLNENTDNTNILPQITQIYTDLFLEHE